MALPPKSAKETPLFCTSFFSPICQPCPACARSQPGHAFSSCAECCLGDLAPVVASRIDCRKFKLRPRKPAAPTLPHTQVRRQEPEDQDAYLTSTTSLYDCLLLPDFEEGFSGSICGLLRAQLLFGLSSVRSAGPHLHLATMLPSTLLPTYPGPIPTYTLSDSPSSPGSQQAAGTTSKERSIDIEGWTVRSGTGSIMTSAQIDACVPFFSISYTSALLEIKRLKSSCCPCFGLLVGRGWLQSGRNPPDSLARDDLSLVPSHHNPSLRLHCDLWRAGRFEGGKRGEGVGCEGRG